MNTALLLIALGFGFKIFAEAGQLEGKSVKTLGRVVGGFVMLVALMGTVFTLWSKCYQGGYPCPSKMKALCPFVEKGQSQNGETASTEMPATGVLN